MSIRFQHEQTHAAETDIEVIVLSAPSRDDLASTHSRYFNSLGELGKRISESLKADNGQIVSASKDSGHDRPNPNKKRSDRQSR